MFNEENNSINYKDITHTEICNAVAEMLMAMMAKHQHGYLLFVPSNRTGCLDIEQLFSEDINEYGRELEDAVAYVDLTDFDLRQIEHIIPKVRSPLAMSVFRTTLENSLPELSERIEDAYSTLSSGWWVDSMFEEETRYELDDELEDYELDNTLEDDTYRGYDHDRDDA